MSEENNTQVTQEEFDQLRSELETERANTQAAVDQASQPLNERIASLSASLAEKDGQLQAAAADLAALQGQSETAAASLDAAVAEYKALVLAANPLLPADLIQGSSIDEVKASLGKAEELVGKVKEGLEASNKEQLQQTTVPAGAPGRTPQDTSGMTAREKINYGLNNTRKER